ncbi:hypothetical protein [Candidatus Amoebophilus asiaticus]|nr:hypothetical protein [Candidatus Amoebophilus asiaticus]
MEAIGLKKGNKQRAEHIARQMLQDGIPMEHIVRWTRSNKR